MVQTNNLTGATVRSMISGPTINTRIWHPSPAGTQLGHGAGRPVVKLAVDKWLASGGLTGARAWREDNFDATH